MLTPNPNAINTPEDAVLRRQSSLDTADISALGRGNRTVHRAAAELAIRARDSAKTGSFRSEALATYRTLVPHDTALFSEFSSAEPATTVDISQTALDLISRCERDFQRYLPDMQKQLQFAEREGGFLDHEVYSLHERRTLPIYTEISLPQGVRSTLLLMPRWRSKPLGYIRLQRHSGKPFSRAEFDRARALLPTIELALTALCSVASTKPRCLPKLSERETEIAEHVSRGLSSPQIALLLGTSPLTVRNQICRIFDKLGLASRAELAGWMAKRARW